MSDKIEHIGVVGSGWLGLPLVGHLARLGDYQLLATTRSANKFERISKAGASPILLDLPLTDSLEAASIAITQVRGYTSSTKDVKQLFSADLLIVTLPPGRIRSNTFEAYQSEIASLIKMAKQHDCGHLIYTSSTGVYGRAQGKVNEQSPTRPATESARAVLAAEQALKNSGIPTTILRLAGLYGPDRNPGKWFQGRTVKEADAPINLVHQQDVLSAVQLVIAHAAWNKTYNLCSQEHPAKRDFYPKAAQAIGLAAPKLEAGGSNGKIVSSEKIRSELGWRSRGF